MKHTKKITNQSISCWGGQGIFSFASSKAVASCGAIRITKLKNESAVAFILNLIWIYKHVSLLKNIIESKDFSLS